MCIANHPVLYSLHMQRLEHSCARVGRYGRQPAVAAAPEVMPQKQPEKAPVRDRNAGFGLSVTAFWARITGGLRQQSARADG